MILLTSLHGILRVRIESTIGVHDLMRYRGLALVSSIIVISFLAFAILGPFIPAVDGHYDPNCTAHALINHGDNWGGCIADGYASLTYYFFRFGAYSFLGVHVPVS